MGVRVSHRSNLFLRGDVDAELFRLNEGGELGVGAVGETIADSEGELGADFHG